MALAVAVALTLAGCGAVQRGTPVAGPGTPSAEPTTSRPPATSTAPGGACSFTATPRDPAARPVPLPTSLSSPPGGVAGSLTLKTNNGDIPLTLDRAKAPCTVLSIEHLVKAKFYDNTPCHRLVSGANFKVLQCGDPTGQGTGGPGYTIPDEKPTDLRAAPVGNGAVVYPRGVIAMANTGQPHSGGSQFFLVFGDTYLLPDYTVFGTIGEPGLTTLDTIGAAGVDPATDAGNGDGAPALSTTITEAVVG